MIFNLKNISIITLVTVQLCISSVIVARENTINTSLDFRAEYESWNTGINGNNKTALFGVGGTHRISNQWSLGVGFMMGPTNKTKNIDTLNRRDLDFTVAYHIHKQVALFTGYRLVTINYTNEIDSSRNFKDLTQGVGFGIGMFNTIYPKLNLYGRFSISGLYSALKFKAANKDRGIGSSTSLEAGLVYEYYRQTTVGISVKQQSATIDYRGDSQKWQHNFIRIGLNLSNYF